MIGQGREAAKQFLRDNPDIAEKLRASIVEKVATARNGDIAKSEKAIAGSRPAVKEEATAAAATA